MLGQNAVEYHLMTLFDSLDICRAALEKFITYKTSVVLVISGFKDGTLYFAV